jgi:type I restriction enzyme S subunit
MKPGYKQTEVGVIPEEWGADNLGRFWGVTDCKHITAQFVTEGFPLASIREVQSRFVDLTNAKQTTAHFYNLLIEGGRKPRPGDLILSRNATVGEVAQVADWHPPFAMGQDVCLLRKKSSDHSTEFLQAIFQSPVILKQLADLMVGSTFKRANVQQIRNFSVPMPPPPEQRAIAEALSDVDGLLGGLDRLIAKKRDLKQAAMQQLLTGQTRLPGFHGEWAIVELGKLIKEIADGATPSTADSRNFGGRIYWVVIDDIKDEIITTATTLTERGLQSCAATLWQPGTLIISTGATIGEVGIARIPVATKQGICGIVFDQSQAIAAFMKYWFVQNKPKILGKAQGSTIKEVRAPTLVKIELTVPPVPEQTAIAHILSEMDAELTALEQRREKTLSLKQAMMQELLTGRTRLL